MRAKPRVDAKKLHNNSKINIKYYIICYWYPSNIAEQDVSCKINISNHKSEPVKYNVYKFDFVEQVKSDCTRKPMKIALCPIPTCALN